MNKPSNKLIKKILNLKEDYTLNLEEGKEDSDLEVIAESIKEEEKENILKSIIDNVFPKVIKGLEKIPLRIYFGHSIPNRPKIHEMSDEDALITLKKFCIDTYGNDFLEKEEFKKNLKISIHKKLIEKFEECIKSVKKDDKSIYDIEKVDNTIYLKKVGQSQVDIKILEDDTKVSSKYLANTSIKDLVEKAIDDNFKRIIKEIEQIKIPEEKPKEDPKEAKKPENPKGEKILKDIANELGLDMKSSTKDASSKDTSSFQNLSSAFETVLQSQNALDITNKAMKLVDSAVECFGVGTLPKTTADTIKNTAKHQEESLQESEETAQKDALKDSGTTVPEVSEISSEEQKIKNFLTQSPKDFKAIRELLTNQAPNRNLANTLIVLRLLVSEPNLFGELGKYLDHCKELKTDMQNTYVAYMTNLFKEYFQSAFYNAEGELKFNANDEKEAEKAIESFASLITGTVDKFPMGPEFHNFISANGIGRGQNGTGATNSLSLAISGLLDAAAILKNKRLSVDNNKELIKWRRKDCRAAHAAFDTQLKAELAKCFENVLKAQFDITSKDGKTTESVPIKDYMFDVEIPRRFKKVLNQQNEEFDKFIRSYYDDSIVDENKGVLKNYFDNVAKDKETASLKYKEKDAEVSTEEVEKDEKASMKAFIEKNDFSEEEKASLQDELEKEDPEEKKSETSPENQNPEASGDTKSEEEGEKKKEGNE